MHVLLFSAKRVHHRAVATWVPKLAPVQLTPARFEMLYAIYQQPFRDIWQGDLVLLLGCAKSTASRMLAALERLGMIVRYGVHECRKLVEPTAKGRAALEAALAMISGARALHDIVASVLTSVGDVERGVIFGFCRRLRDIFGERHPLDPYDPACARALRSVSPLAPFDGN